jgi:hypothetical protein
VPKSSRSGPGRGQVGIPPWNELDQWQIAMRAMSWSIMDSWSDNTGIAWHCIDPRAPLYAVPDSCVFSRPGFTSAIAGRKIRIIGRFLSSDVSKRSRILRKSTMPQPVNEVEAATRHLSSSISSFTRHIPVEYVLGLVTAGFNSHVRQSRVATVRSTLLIIGGLWQEGTGWGPGGNYLWAGVLQCLPRTGNGSIWT